MSPGALVLIHVELVEPAEEEDFLAWWRGARALLVERFRLGGAGLAVIGRGRYAITLDFPLPGAWKLVARDPRWRDLEALRPRAAFAATVARPFHLDGNPRDITTAELAGWIGEHRDFTLVDALSHDSFTARHLPGAVNLPFADIDTRAATLLGPKQRPLVVYCSNYG
jgi:Rhodanese-like domain